MVIAALEKNGAPSAARPVIAFGSSIDMSPKAEENPPSLCMTKLGAKMRHVMLLLQQCVLHVVFLAGAVT
jgi:hypothetical protein